MTSDERIKEEFEKWSNNAYYTTNERVFMDMFKTMSDRVKASVYYAGFRAAERLAKIEALEEALIELQSSDSYEAFERSLNSMIAELKEEGE